MENELYSFCSLLMVLFSPGRSEGDPRPAKSERKPRSGVWHHTDITSRYTRDMAWHGPGGRGEEDGGLDMYHEQLLLFIVKSRGLMRCFCSRVGFNFVSQSCRSPGSVSQFQLVTRILSRVAPVHSPRPLSRPAVTCVYLYFTSYGQAGDIGRCGGGDGNLNIEPGAIRLW